jgi:hypothetical protein
MSYQNLNCHFTQILPPWLFFCPLKYIYNYLKLKKQIVEKIQLFLLWKIKIVSWETVLPQIQSQTASKSNTSFSKFKNICHLILAIFTCLSLHGLLIVWKFEKLAFPKLKILLPQVCYMDLLWAWETFLPQT